MKFVGIDLAWSNRNNTGLASIEGNKKEGEVKRIFRNFGEKERDDLESFKTQFINSRRRRRDGLGWEAGYLGDMNSKKALEYVNKYEEQVLSITPKRIMSTARKYLNPKDFYVSIVK